MGNPYVEGNIAEADSICLRTMYCAVMTKNSVLLRDLAEPLLVLKHELVDCADLAPNIFKRVFLDMSDLSLVEPVGREGTGGGRRERERDTHTHTGVQRQLT